MTSQLIIEVKMTEMSISHNDAIIRSSGIGSCVVVTMYDPVNRVGGLFHAILPQRVDYLTAKDEEEPNAKYADEAIVTMLKELQKLGANKADIRAKIIGGAEMFKNFATGAASIGSQNVESAKKKLAELQINLESEDTGGTIGRSVEFTLVNGLVTVNTKM
ncbi:chemotaxis protein CheD [Patescibacteria group bacterium]|nr:chemotaxis protein CheD [Patescibacteria group bacterium]